MRTKTVEGWLCGWGMCQTPKASAELKPVASGKQEVSLVKGAEVEPKSIFYISSLGQTRALQQVKYCCFKTGMHETKSKR